LPAFASLATLLLVTAHPHLFFTASDVAALQAKAAGTHQAIASNITQVLSQHFLDPAPQTSDYDDPRFFGQDVCAWGFAWQLTKDPSYAAQARLRLSTYLGWSDWGFGEVQSEGVPDLSIAHFLIGVSCAYDLVYDYLSAADRSALAARIGTEAQRMYANWRSAWYADDYVQNHNWINGAGLGLAALALAGEDSRSSSWLSLAQGNLATASAVLASIPDGSWHEGIRYEDYGLSMSLPFSMALLRTGADYTDAGIWRGLGRMFLAATIPDAARTQILTHGDFSGWLHEDIVEILRFAAAHFHDGVAEAAAQRWLAAGSRTRSPFELFYEVFEFLAYDQTVSAVAPSSLPLDTNLSDLQAAVLHSTWATGDLALAFKAGPYGGRANFDRMKAGGGSVGGHLNWGHDHNDDMSFWLWGSGTWLAPEAVGYDAGVNTSFSIDKRANLTSFHNGLLVDGNGELGDTRQPEYEVGNAWFFQRDAVPLLAPTGTADYAFAGGRGASLYDASLGLTRWDRLVVLARKRYALVRDDLVANAAHDFDWICHFLDGANPDTASGWVQGVARNGMFLGVRVVSPPAWTATTGSQSANLTSNFDSDGAISWVRVRPSTKAASAQFLAALVPVQQSAWSARVRIDALASGDEGAGAVVAPGSSLEERWIFGRASAASKTAGDLVLTGSLAGMAARNAGAPVRALLAGPGSLADQSGGRVLLSTRSARSIQVDLQGSTLAVTGDGITDFQAYAPSASSVTLNGQAVAAQFLSGVVQFPGGFVTTLVSSPPALTNQTAASFAFSSTRTGATFSCRIDGGAASVCTSPKAYAALVDGAHSFAVVATDSNGLSSAPVSSSWTVDTVAPVTTIVSGPSQETTETSATFAFRESKPGAVVEYALDGAAEFKPCDVSLVLPGQSGGAHELRARGRDALGNREAAPVSYRWTVVSVASGTFAHSGCSTGAAEAETALACALLAASALRRRRSR
jgi:Domain of unknown function (DUF4962)/Heparinase II/III-like protein